MMVQLNERAETRDALPGDDAVRELVCWVQAVGAVGCGLCLPSKAIRIEPHGMHVDLLTIRCLQDEACGEEVVGNSVAMRSQRSLQPLDVVEAHHNVCVFVLTMLLAQQSIDAPTAVQPDLDVSCGKDVEQLQHARGRHGHVRHDAASRRSNQARGPAP